MGIGVNVQDIPTVWIGRYHGIPQLESTAQRGRSGGRMSTPARPQPSDPEWDGDDRDLDAVGLAAHFAEHARRTGGTDGDPQQALGAWLDELIAELEAEADGSRG